MQLSSLLKAAKLLKQLQQHKQVSLAHTRQTKPAALLQLSSYTTHATNCVVAIALMPGHLCLTLSPTLQGGYSNGLPQQGRLAEMQLAAGLLSMQLGAKMLY
jgi:hypothetical protein